MSDADLALALGAGGLARRVLERDLFAIDERALVPGGPAPAIYVVAGQLAAGVFEPQDLVERRQLQDRVERLTTQERADESLLKPAPLARVAQKNVALFVEGDLFNSGAVTAARGAPVALFTLAPAELLFLDQRTVADLAARYPFFEQRFSRALFAGRERLAGVTGVKQEILDFFVRQGLSVAGDIVRVRQLGLCIDCKLCEEACEERYGARRLTLGGYQLGMLDFIYTCRTCTDQRCIDPCAYDSIKFDAEKREVVINEATCTGCTACAQACPYGAIDMIDIDDPSSPTFKPDFKQRLDKRGALAHGAGTGRLAKVRRIANKCDHCGAYGDQACVSACPTGSLIEVDTYDLFRERSPRQASAARAGFLTEVESERREVLPVHPFTDPAPVRDGGAAKVKRGRYAPIVMWAVGVAGFLAALTEVLLRAYAPKMSYQFSQLRADSNYEGLPDAAVLDKISFRSGDELAVWCGVIGTALMFVAAIYPVFRRIRVFRWLASNTMWFDFHLMSGTVGPMFVGLHSAWSLGSWVAIAFWTMVIVVVSGFIGRYLYTQVPSLSSGLELEELDHERAFQMARVGQPQAMADLDREMAEHRAHAEGVARSPSVLGALWWLLLEDVQRPWRGLQRRSRLGHLGLRGRVRRDLGRRTGRMIVIDRGRVVAPKAQLLLHSWKKVHVPFTILLTVVAAAHIWISWGRAF
ncbi:MAG: 4Fe-4S binding protein [Kofleriaceae bacterium]|nr:4Fe-4S binding protein [Kofleriaceae bacterium]MBP6837492.1 4Fe-4S binding protein [Kofleriaceae bacterium]MBP9206856.1 4Fe-4S binding protein [Kofleriaceae bacterium]